jgi:hypothetical protein
MERASRSWQPDHSLSRTLAATVGSVPAALAIGVALAAVLPLRVDQRVLVGSYAVLPVWVGAACCLFLAPTGRRAWSSVLAVVVIASLIAAVALALGGSLRGAGASP